MVWHITEPESFFKEAAVGIRPISHAHKRLQHLCGRYLLLQLVPHFPLHQIVAEQNNKPFIPDNPYHFSISHCDDFVAAIVSTKLSVGVDVETISEKVWKVQHKFLTEAEEKLLLEPNINRTELELLTLAWSAKETLFKYLGESGVDFKEHLVLQHLKGTASDGLILATTNRNIRKEVVVQYRYLQSVVLTWMAQTSEQPSIFPDILHIA